MWLRWVPERLAVEYAWSRAAAQNAAVQETAAHWAFNKRRFELRSGLISVV